MDTLNDDHPRSTMPEIIAPGLHRSTNTNQRAGASKADARYWLIGKRLALHDSANYSIQLFKQGQRAWFPLGTPNKKSAAAKAAEIYSFIQAHGWQSALDRYKPSAVPAVESATVGTLINAACRISSARRESLDAYTKAFRRIVSEIKGIKSDRKHDFHGGGVAEWQGMVDAVSLASITPAEVVAWKNRRLREAETDPLAKRRAIVTVNSLIRNSKALFGKKILPFVEQTVPLPRPLPFDGVTMEKAPSMRYVSKIDPYAILASAREELAEPHPEAFKVMLLALVCGLRRSEIDNLLWRAFDFPNSKLRVETTEFHELKSEDSAGEIDLDADTLAMFRGYRAKNPTSVFVIESPHRPRSEMKARCYRCDAVFKLVLEWLRAKGVDASKPLHTLRKEIGSLIASEHGIFEASRYLRHSDIRITSAIYADKKKTVTPKAFAGLLAAAPAAQSVDFKKQEPDELGAMESSRNANG
jgi:integrase